MLSTHAGLEATTSPLKRQSRILKDLKGLVHGSAAHIVADTLIDGGQQLEIYSLSYRLIHPILVDGDPDSKYDSFWHVLLGDLHGAELRDMLQGYQAINRDQQQLFTHAQPAANSVPLL